MRTTFNELMNGLDYVQAFLAGERRGFKEHVADEVHMKAFARGSGRSLS